MPAVLWFVANPTKLVTNSSNLIRCKRVRDYPQLDSLHYYLMAPSRKRAASQAQSLGRLQKRRKKMSDHKKVKTLWNAANNQLYKIYTSFTNYGGGNQIAPLATSLGQRAYTLALIGAGAVNAERNGNYVFWQRGVIALAIHQSLRAVADGFNPQIGIRVIIGLVNRGCPSINDESEGSEFGTWLRPQLFDANPVVPQLNQPLVSKDRVPARANITVLKDRIIQLPQQKPWYDTSDTATWVAETTQHVTIPFSMKNHKGEYLDDTVDRAQNQCPFIYVMTDSGISGRLGIELQFRLGFTDDKIPTRA